MAKISPSKSSDRFQESVQAGYEVPDENTLGIFGVGVLALILGFGIFMVCWWLFDHFKQEVKEDQIPHSVFAPPIFSSEEKLPPPPRLQLNPQLDLAKMLKRDDDILNTVGWLKSNESEKGAWVRIPIDDAMNLLVEEDKRKGTLRQ